MLKIERNLAAGVPQTVVAGFAPRGLMWHWSAGATGRSGATGTLNHLINTRLTTNASYHILLFREGLNTIAQWIVPSNHAAHSMNPAKAYVHSTRTASRAREAERFTETKRILGAKANDPNGGSIAVSFCGMPADLAAAMRDPIFVADVRALAKSLIDTFPSIIDRPHFGHGWVQPSTRYEMDAIPGGSDLLISTLYATPAAPQEDDMPTLDVYKLERTIIGPNARIRSAPTGENPANPPTFLTPSDRNSAVTSIGEVDGYLAYWVAGWKAWGYTSIEHNVVARQPYDEWVESQVQVPEPSGLTQAQVDALIAAAVVAEQAKVPDQIAAAVETALEPYKRRIDEFKQLAGRALS